MIPFVHSQCSCELMQTVDYELKECLPFLHLEEEAIVQSRCGKLYINIQI